MNGAIYTGIAGWSYQDWNGIVYANTKIDQLEYVSRFVDCITVAVVRLYKSAEGLYNAFCRRCSSMVEHSFRKAEVVSSSLTIGCVLVYYILK